MICHFKYTARMLYKNSFFNKKNFLLDRMRELKMTSVLMKCSHMMMRKKQKLMVGDFSYCLDSVIY